jgi:hypothetical protein
LFEVFDCCFLVKFGSGAVVCVIRFVFLLAKRFLRLMRRENCIVIGGEEGEFFEKSGFHYVDRVFSVVELNDGSVGLTNCVIVIDAKTFQVLDVGEKNLKGGGSWKYFLMCVGGDWKHFLMRICRRNIF